MKPKKMVICNIKKLQKNCDIKRVIWSSNLSSNTNEAQNGPNFITLGRISEQEEIIQTGFQRQAEGKISLRNYYEGTEDWSFLKLKGYSIKYQTIRRTKF
jgi:hypothetical protein